jgi:Na+/H+ antiporter NhaC
VEKQSSNQSSSFLGSLSLLPFAGFLTVYIGAGLWFMAQGQEMAFYQFPAPSCALFGFGLALLIGFRHVRVHIKTFASGVGDETVVLMCLIFLLAGAFSSLSQAAGSVDAAVNLGIFLLPDRLLLPGLFLISCFVSFSMGTSMGTISTVVPIAIGISEAAGLSLPLVAGTVLGGAMFGDNLSVISDTTIAATGTQGCSMRDKMRANLKVALPAASIVFVLLWIIGEVNARSLPADLALIKVVPYALVLFLAIRGVHVVIVLMLGIMASLIVGLGTGSFPVLEIGKLIYSGFISMADVFFVTILIAGMSAIAAKEGGLDFLLQKLSPLAKGKRSAEAVIAISVSLADICVANNTVAILFTGQLAKGLAAKFKIDKARSASILDVFSCVWQGIIPHGAQVLLVGGLCKLSGFSVLLFSFYPMVLGIISIIAIAIGDRKTHGS